MFGEKTTETIKGKQYKVWQSPKYEESRAKAIEIINAYEGITEGDFWILKNTTDSGMTYSGLIMSHNGCLKLNDTLDKDKRFDPDCVSVDKDGYNHSLVYTYCNAVQGIYEVGEFSPSNSKQAYPYAMAYKRLFDRVVLKNSRLAYSGIYSEVEADEFKAPVDEFREKPEKNEIEETLSENATELELQSFRDTCESMGLNHKDVWKLTGKATDLSKAHLGLAQTWLVEHATASGRN